MADYYKYPVEKGVRFYLAGALHDVGKLMIKNEILQKPGKLTDEEFEIMKSRGKGTHGHIAISTWDVDRAVYHLSRAGASFDESTRTRDDKGSKFIYLEGEFGGFAIHLIRK